MLLVINVYLVPGTRYTAYMTMWCKKETKKGWVSWYLVPGTKVCRTYYLVPSMYDTWYQVTTTMTKWLLLSSMRSTTLTAAAMPKNLFLAHIQSL